MALTSQPSLQGPRRPPHSLLSQPPVLSLPQGRSLISQGPLPVLQLPLLGQREMMGPAEAARAQLSSLPSKQVRACARPCACMHGVALDGHAKQKMGSKIFRRS